MNSGAPYDVVIRQGQVVLPDGVQRLDIGVRSGRIAALAPELAGSADLTLDAAGHIVLPGLIDPHVHMGIPIKDTWSADNFTSGSVAAAFGGVTTILDFTVQQPGQTLRQALNDRLARAHAQCHVDYGVHVNITDQPLTHLDEIPALIAEGFSSFKVFSTYREAGMMIGWPDFRAVLDVIAQQGGLLMLHAEDNDLVESLTARHLAAGRRAPIYHARSRPAEAEARAIEQAAAIAGDLGAPLYVVHVSSRLSLEAGLRARTRGVQIYLETCPQYLALDESRLESPHGHWYIATPALRTRADAEALWEALAADEIDAVGTDHCPFTRAQKEAHGGHFAYTPNGLPAVETRLPLLATLGVAAGRLTWPQLVRVCAANPARLFGLEGRKGALAVGMDADLAIWDPTPAWVIADENQHGSADWSPYAGQRIQGKLNAVLLRGQLIIQGENFLGAETWGRLLRAQVSRG